MKKRVFMLLASLGLFGVLLSGCAFQGEKKTENSAQQSTNAPKDGVSFSMQATKNRFLLNEDNYISIMLTDIVGLKDVEINNIRAVTTTDTADALIRNNGKNELRFVGNRVGTTTFYAVAVKDNKTYQSTNEITIETVLSTNKISENISNVLTNRPVLGKAYDVGIVKEEVSSYQIEGADGILRFNSEGLLEVCGFGRIEPTIKCGSEVLFNRSCQVFISMMCTEIRNTLYEQGKIRSRSENVTNDLFQHIKTINMDGYIVNDPDCALGIKYLSNLEELDLSNNYLEEISFLSPLTKLKKINFAHNFITDLSPLYKSETSLEDINMQDNNATELNTLATFTNLKKLNLSDNKITNIDFLSGVDSLEELNLNHNNVQTFNDGLSGLFNLKKLSLAYTGLNFVNIRSLTYLNQLKYLDISGSSTMIEQLRTYNNLEGLRVADCSLSTQNLTFLNNLRNLKILDISNNDLMDDVIDRDINYEALSNVEELCIGGNLYTNVPNIVNNFANLKVLDLTNSYNVEDIDLLYNSKIEELILDECNNLGNHFESNGTYSNAYKILLNSMTNLKKLSIVGGLNYMTKELFYELESKVVNGDFALRFLEETYVDQNTISDYTSDVYFTMDAFLNACTKNESNEYKINFANRHVILSLVNDDTDLATSGVTFVVPKGLRRIDLYGRKDKIYNVSFNIERRKESSFTIELVSFVNRSSSGRLWTAEDVFAKVQVKGANNSYSIDNLDYVFNNCHLDNGWNPNNQDNNSNVKNVQADCVQPMISGAVNNNGKYVITSPSSFRVYGKMRYPYNKIPYKTGNTTKTINDDGYDGTIYGTEFKTKGRCSYGQAVGHVYYSNGSIANIDIASYFQNKLAGDEVLLCGSDYYKTGNPIVKIEIVIVFEIEHKADAFLSSGEWTNWRYDITIPFEA